MPVYLFDSSALCKRYFVNEAGAGVMDDLVRVSDSERFVLNLAIVETLNAFYRVCREGHVTQAERDAFVAKFYEDIANSTLLVYSVRDEHVLGSEPILEALQTMRIENKRPGLIDALVVACALDFDPTDRVLVSSDRDLNNLASQFGIDTLDPEQPVL